MAFTDIQLAALEKAIAQGVRSVEYDGKRITYHSLEEMQRLRDQIKSELGRGSVSGGRCSLIYFGR